MEEFELHETISAVISPLSSLVKLHEIGLIYRYLFDSCYDMLCTLLVWSITDPMNAVPVNPQDPDTKFRFANYSVIVKKLRVSR